MDILARATDAINSASDIRAIVKLIADESAQMAATGKATVFLFNDDGEVDSTSSVGLPQGFAHEVERLGRGQWALSGFMKADLPQVVSTKPGGPYSTPLHKLAALEGLTTLGYAWMTYATRIMGLVVIYLEAPHQLDQAGVDSLCVLANVGALAIVHLRLAETRKWERASQDQFLDVLSHELRTPLTSIMGFTQVIRRRFLAARDTDRQLRDQLELLWAQTQRLHRLLDAFVDMSNIERGEFTIERERMDIASALSHGIAQAKAQFRSRHHFKVQLPDHPLWLLGDVRRLEHVFIHLVSNATRYSSVDQPVQIVCEEYKHGQVVVSVGDRGPGIPANVQREISKPFYPSEARKAGGMGMGLFFSRAIVEAHGGKLQIDSEPGAGTTVSVYLPLAE
jgi:signal transduction histidine kinase